MTDPARKTLNGFDGAFHRRALPSVGFPFWNSFAPLRLCVEGVEIVADVGIETTSPRQ
jgi:hypothetical protein